MELNEKTIKKGVKLYYLRIKRDRSNASWAFHLSRAEIIKFKKDEGGFCYHLWFNIPWANQIILQGSNLWQTKFIAVYNNIIHGNDKPILKLKGVNHGYYGVDYEFLCDSFDELIKTLKQLIFNGKGNESTKRARLKAYRELIRQWTKSPYRDNFYAWIC